MIIVLTVYKHSAADGDCTPVNHVQSLLERAAQLSPRRCNHNGVGDDQRDAGHDSHCTRESAFRDVSTTMVGMRRTAVICLSVCIL